MSKTSTLNWTSVMKTETSYFIEFLYFIEMFDSVQIAQF